MITGKKGFIALFALIAINVAFVVLLVLGARRVCAHLQIKNEDLPSQPQIAVTQSRAWALACSAVLTETNGRRHDLLAGCEIDKVNISNWKKSLDNWWGVKNRVDLLDTLELLDSGGHRERFSQVGSQIAELSEQAYQQLLDMNKNDKEKLQEVVIARKYYEELGSKGLLGWDYSRYISLCRWGYLVGYISEQEAWDRIMPVAKMLQESFGSWQELGENYLIGRQFWSYKYTKLNGYFYERSYHELLEDPSSPWNIYPWDMNLTHETEVIEDDLSDQLGKSDI